MIEPAAAFAYVAIVPSPADGPVMWRLAAERIDDLARLTQSFGREPTLTIADAAVPANASPERPRVLRSRLTLAGNDRTGVFYLDRSLMSALRAGDVMHVARSERGGLGLSVLRNDRLVAAVGAITIVPLGQGVTARISPDRHDEAMAIVEPPDGEWDWNYRDQFRDEWPLEIQIDGATHLFFRRNETIHGLQLFIVHGLYVKPPGRWPPGSSKPKAVLGVAGKDECIALARIGQCPAVSANASAYLLEADGLEMI